MIGQREALRLFGCEVFDPRGRRVGIVGQLFVEEEIEQPAWITVQIGLFGTNESCVPLDGAAFDGDTLTVAVRKSAVRRAPLLDARQGELSMAQEHALYLYYGRACGVVPEQCAADDRPGVRADGSACECVAAVRSRLRGLSAAS